MNLILILLGFVLTIAIALYFAQRAGWKPDWQGMRDQVLNPEGPVRRMWPLWIIFAFAFAYVLNVNPMKAGLTMYGIGKVALGGIIGYVVDVCVYRAQDRPHLLTGIERGTAWKRRAWIVCACIIAMAFVP